jgi:hypothetical protein
MISKLRLIFCLTACLAILFAPFMLGISLDGKAYAMGFLGSSGGSDNSSSPAVTFSSPEQTNPNPPTTYPNPEPATLLLFGAGAIGLAAFRKKFRKK